MKAWILREIGDIRLEETAVPEPKAGEVLVRVMAAGICGSDIPRIYRTGAHRMPLIPGHEFSGCVAQVGAGVSEKWIGKRVGIYPLIPCGQCGPCREGRAEMCRRYDYVGSRRDGAFAEYVTVPSSSLLELPGAVSYEKAAMLEPLAVALHAVRTGTGRERDKADPEKPIAICGLGPIGLLILSALVKQGYRRIFLIGNKAAQAEVIAQLLGQEVLEEGFFCDSQKQDPAKWLKERCEGPEIYFECVGSEESLKYGLEAAAPGGRIVTVGNPRGDLHLQRDLYWRILRNQLTLSGTWNSTFFPEPFPEEKEERSFAPRTDRKRCGTDWEAALQILENPRFFAERLITHRFPLERLEEGFRIMRDKGEYSCKILMTCPDDPEAGRQRMDR